MVVLYKFVHKEIQEEVIILSLEVAVDRIELYERASLESLSIFFRIRRERLKKLKQLEERLQQKMSLPLLIPLTPKERCYKDFPKGWSFIKDKN